MVNVPSLTLYALRGVFGGWRDDNFISGWTLSVGAGTFATDNDVVTLTVTVAQAGGTWQKTVPNNISTNTFNKLTARIGVSPASETIKIFVNYTDLTNDSITINSLYPTIIQLSLTAGKTISFVSVRVESVSSTAVGKVDWITIGSSPYLDLTPKMRALRARRPLGWDIGQAQFEIQDEGGYLWTSPNIIAPGDVLAAYGKTSSGGATKRLWGGTVQNLSKNSKTGMRRTSIVSLGWDKSLQGTQVFAYYGGQTDTAMVNDIITKINTGQQSPQVLGWNLAQESGFAGPIDPAVVTINAQQIEAQRALLDLSDYTSIAITGAKGCDFLVTPSEVFRYKRIGGYTNDGSFSDSDWTELNLDYHIFDVKTAVTVLGSWQYPQSPDEWTESNDVWTNVGTSVTHSFVATGINGGIGAKQLKATVAAGNSVVCGVKYTFPTALDLTAIGSLYDPPVLNMSYAEIDNQAHQVSIRLYDGTKYFYFQPGLTSSGATTGGNPVTVFDNTTSLQSLSLPVGPYAGNSGNTSPSWLVNSTPNWNHITAIEINVASNATETKSLCIDGLHFAGTHGETYIDNRSGKGEAQFGRRELVLLDPIPKPITGSPGIKETAQAELFKWRDPITSGRLVFDNNLAFDPGDLVTLTSTNYNYTNKNFRIIAVNYQWDPSSLLGGTGTGSGQNIRTELEITDFAANTMSRQIGDLFQEMSKWDAVSRGDQVLMKFRSYIAYEGVIPAVNLDSTAASSL